MKFIDYLKSKLIFIIVFIFSLLYLSTFLVIFKIGIVSIIFLVLGFLLFFICYLLFDYFKKNKFYNELKETLKSIDKKYLVTELVSRPDFYEGALLYDLLKEINSYVLNDIKLYQLSIEELNSYLEKWIHEIKIPISCIGLICNNNINDSTKSILDETVKIDRFLEQFLYFSKASNLENNYIIKEFTLEDVINDAVRSYYKELIILNTRITIDAKVCVLSDRKRIYFILCQIISNSIKYISSFDNGIGRFLFFWY